MTSIAFVWGENESATDPAPPPTLSVSAWPYLFDKKWVRWDTSREHYIPAEIMDAAVVFVNLFHTADSIHIERIREMYPHCFIVAMPDPTLDLVLAHHDWTNMYRQMSMADMIGGRTRHDCEVYGTLLNKPTVVLPSPVGPEDWFKQFRGLQKDDYLLTLDHRFAPNNTLLNVAVVAAVQRKTGCRVIYAAEREQTKVYAAQAGLKCEFVGDVPFTEFATLTAKARLCVDMYASHSYGRQGVLCAEVGTFCIGSSWCSDVGQAVIDPFEVKAAADMAIHWWNVDEDYRAQRYQQQHNVVEVKYGFRASKDRLEKLLGRLESDGLLWHS